jgi:hypothetical protein
MIWLEFFRRLACTRVNWKGLGTSADMVEDM